MRRDKIYPGIDRVEHGAMDATGNIIRDAWVFGLIPEAETCQGWNVQAIQQLYDQVTSEWLKYGHLVSALPDELRERHQRIYSRAVEQARAAGWDPELDDDEDA